jgi:hypothetical protein
MNTLGFTISPMAMGSVLHMNYPLFALFLILQCLHKQVKQYLFEKRNQSSELDLKWIVKRNSKEKWESRKPVSC